MVYLITALVVTSVALLVYGLTALAPARSRAITRRLAEIEASTTRSSYAVQRRIRQEKRERLESLLQTFGERVASKKVDWSEIQHMLVKAGYRRSSAVSIYLGLRVFSVLVFGGVGLLSAAAAGASTPAMAMVAGGVGVVGWIVPRWFVRRRVAKRNEELQLALADTLDLLVVCVEAGLGLNQALVRVSDEIEHVSTTMSEELMLTNLEMRAGTPRDEALRNLGNRSGVEDLKALTAMLVQTDRFGTSIATALRVHSETMRTKRRQRAEEAAAKTTIKLVFPLVLFIFPAMFVVILGPAILHIMAQMKELA